MSEQATCRSCKAPIRWAITEANGKRIPLDPDPTPDGNIVLADTVDIPTGAPIARYLKKGEQVTFPTLALAVGGQAPERLRYTSHFATCPNADEHRKKK